MKFLLTLIATSTLSYGAMQDGQYQGEGSWKLDDKRGEYQVTTSIQGNKIKNKYAYGNTSVIFEILIEMDKNERFLVRDLQDNVIGNGYCMFIQCHYEITKGIKLEETLTFYNGHLYRVGSKTQDGKFITWIEDQEIRK